VCTLADEDKTERAARRSVGVKGKVDVSEPSTSGNSS
jgi:hypothetical protein